MRTHAPNGVGAFAASQASGGRARLAAALLLLQLAAGAAAAAAQDAGVRGEYRLFAGDEIRIDVFSEPSLSIIVRLADRASVSFPLVGNLGCITSMTVDEVTRLVADRLARGFLRHPVVTVSILDYGVRTAFVMGSVAKPGGVPLNPVEDMGALQAIGQAGGFLDEANCAAAFVLRDGADPGRHKTILAVAVANVGAQDVVLRSGDIVMVPRLDRVYVIGQVTKPGAVDLPSREVLTIAKAISIAGGFDKYAKEAEVQLIRAGQRVRSVDVRGILEGNKGAEDLPLQPGDTVFIPEGRF